MSTPLFSLADDLFVVEEAITKREAQQLLAFGRRYADGEKPNSMNKYGVILDRAPCRPLINRLMRRLAVPCGSFWGLKLRPNPYAFLVEYTADTQRSLARHFDSSDVTLNVCLSDANAFRGGQLVTYQTKTPLFYEQTFARAFVHKGSLNHRAEAIFEGHRTNLVLWCAKK